MPTEPKSSSSPATYGDELVGCQDIMKNYSFVIHCTGLLWYAKLSVSNSTKWATPFDCQKYSVPKLIFFVGDLLPPGKLNYTKSSKENYHAFWNNTFSGLGIKDNIMMIGCAPTNNITPVGVDFYKQQPYNFRHTTIQSVWSRRCREPPPLPWSRHHLCEAAAVVVEPPPLLLTSRRCRLAAAVVGHRIIGQK